MAIHRLGPRLSCQLRHNLLWVTCIVAGAQACGACVQHEQGDAEKRDLEYEIVMLM